MSLPWTSIYGPCLSTYSSVLRHLYRMNAMIFASGTLAPNIQSKLNTEKLYEAIGRPLDRIPSILIGGTNGKVHKTRIYLL